MLESGKRRQLTPEQEQAVSHVNGPMMVVAGPGSGKTMVLTERIRRLLSHTRPERILVITFAKKAAAEMQERFAALAGEEAADKVLFGTFHAVFYRWLRRWRVLSNDVQILEEEGARALYQKLGWDQEEVPALFLSRGDTAKRYAEEKRRQNMVDFEDLMELTEKEIGRHAMWKEYDFVLIDEFQDINPQQYRIVKQIVGVGTVPRPNLFVVGDEDQAIYAFRGSDPGIFLRLPEDFSGCIRIDLTRNFRCQAYVVEAAGRLIAHNQLRFNKKITAQKPAEFPLQIHCVYGEEDEAMRIRDQVMRAHRGGVPWEEMAILCRTTAQMQSIMAALTEGGAAYSCRESLQTDGRAEALLIEQDLSWFLRLSRDPADREAYRQLMQFLPGLKTAGNIYRVPQGAAVLEALLKQPMKAEARQELAELQSVLKKAARKTDRQALLYFWRRTEYSLYARGKGKKRGVRRAAVWRQLQSLAREKPAKQQGISVLTMHGAKGLEFDWVWCAGLTEGKCPHIDGELEEERRLFYVAMTRARRWLHISYYEEEGARASRFIQEIEEIKNHKKGKKPRK